MLKIRIIAACVAVIMTLATVYAVPYLYIHVTQWLHGLSPTHKQWFNYSQIFVGFLVALITLRVWFKKKRTQA
jgi:uncharacterized membrane protein YcgQ (UPF0703/DUF1980 family)